MYDEPNDLSELVERAVDQIAFEIAERDGKWNFRLLTMTVRDGDPMFYSEFYADYYEHHEDVGPIGYSRQAIGVVAFDDEGE